METSDVRLVAVPSWWPGGLGARRHASFEFCDCFTAVALSGGRPATTTVITNPLHTRGRSLPAVTLLLSHFVDTVIVREIGPLPLAALLMEGVRVFEGHSPRVSDAVRDFTRGLLTPASVPEEWEYRLGGTREGSSFAQGLPGGE